MVRQVEGRDLWTIERWMSGLGPEVDQVLVLDFEATPVFTKNGPTAMQLAEYCHANTPPPGLTWFVSPPTSWGLNQLVELARKRRTAEEEALRSLRVAPRTDDPLDIKGSKQTWSDVLNDCYEPLI
jgi:hypothetical protein